MLPQLIESHCPARDGIKVVMPFFNDHFDHAQGQDAYSTRCGTPIPMEAGTLIPRQSGTSIPIEAVQWFQSNPVQ